MVRGDNQRWDLALGVHAANLTPVVDPVERAQIALEGLSIGDALGQRFFFAEIATSCGPGAEPPPPWWWTDDTNMALSVVEVLSNCGAIDQAALATSFKTRFDPSRQYGPAMYELLPELSPDNWSTVSSALFDGSGSYGNGAAMRVAPVGAFFADDLDQCIEEAERSAVVTHSHPEAAAGAVAVAVAAALGTRASGHDPPDAQELLAQVVELTPASEVRARLDRVRQRKSGSVASVAAAVGNGARVSAQDTVPFAVWCAATFIGDFEAAVWAAISAGGDMDTTAAMVGGIVSSYVGIGGIPARWREAREPLPANL